jgi:hypothetical protein
VTALDEYVERVTALPEELTIGLILWFTISGVHVKLDDITNKFDELELSTKYLPKRIQPIDAFRKATSEPKVEYAMPWVGPDIKARILIREVAKDGDQVVRHVMREMVDSSNRRLSYEKVGEAIYYRPSRGSTGPGRIRTAVMPDLEQSERDNIASLLGDVTSRYHEMMEYLDSQAVRAVLRNYLTDLNAISVKPSGGVYFVHKSRQATIEMLRQLVVWLGGTSVLHTLPLVDSPDQRDMLAEAFVSGVEGEVKDLLAEIARANSTVSLKKHQALLARYASLKSRAEEYDRVLGIAQKRTESALGLALSAVMGVGGRVTQ